MVMFEVMKKEALQDVRCRSGCPAKIDVPRFVDLAEKGKFTEALAVIWKRNPFPSVTGRVCPAFCEATCRRSEVDEAVAINAIERFVCEQASGHMPNEGRDVQASGKRIAVIGSGPAGLTAAYYLSKLGGHSVQVFEKFPEPGGMLRYGIPVYRMPEKALAFDIDHIKSVGVNIRTNTKIETLDDVPAEDFDAILWAGGAGMGQKLSIPGAEFDNAIIGLFGSEKL